MLTLVIRFVLFALVAVLISFASYCSIILAMAEHLSMADSLAERQRATALIPGDATNWIRLAEFQQKYGMEALTAYSRAAKASPLNANAWIGIGLEEELLGHFQLAEQNLLQAARVSREYIPRWTLANYYYRRNDSAHFWPWAKQALTIGVSDLQPIFRMAWALSGDADLISEKAIPDRPLVLAQYLVWLAGAGKLDAAQTISQRLLPQATQDEVPSLQYYCDRQLAEGHFAAAQIAWNGLVARKLLTAEAVPTASGLEDGMFSREPLNTGLDWRTPVLAGVALRSTLPGLRLNFSGRQPEACEPLWQYVSLEPNRLYRINYEYYTSGIPAAAGLSWRVFDAKTAVEFTKDPPSLAHEQPVRESLTFATPAGVSGGRLALTYRRAPGTTRIEGWLQLKQVELHPAN